MAFLVISCSLRGSSISPCLGVLTDYHECLQLLIHSYVSCLSRNPDACKPTANSVNKWEVWEENVLERDTHCSWACPVWDEGRWSLLS